MSWVPYTVTMSGDPSGGLLLRVQRDEEFFEVSDVVGLRYGHGPTLGEALEMWNEQVRDILEIPDDKLGEPLKSEVARYRIALRPRVAPGTPATSGGLPKGPTP